MRVEVGALDKSGDEQFYYLDFDEITGALTYTIEYISRSGEESSMSWPLHEAVGQRGHHRALAYVRDKLFSQA